VSPGAGVGALIWRKARQQSCGCNARGQVTVPPQANGPRKNRLGKCYPGAQCEDWM